MGAIDQETEIGELKATFSGKVKVISNVGDFTNVITVFPTDKNIQIKFQLTDGYPESPPTISIVSSSLNQDQLSTLLSVLTEKTSSKQSNSTIKDSISSCFTWLEQNELDLTPAPESDKSPTKSNKKTKQKKCKSKKPEDDTVVSQKKPSMKTSLDVIKRINWDEAVDKSDFIVGYMDRIVGLVERPFEEFTWEDLASVDHYSLAIPQHRIQYFKYKHEKVWDKNERLDNVFGSTGSKITIVEAMERYEARQTQDDGQEDRQETTEGAIGGQDGGNTKLMVDLDDAFSDHIKLEDYTEDTAEQKPHDGSRCKIEGVVSATSHLTATESDTVQKTHTILEACNVTDDLFVKKGNFRYNFFVGLEITNSSLLDYLKKVQAELVDRYPQYGPYKTPENGFHLTLAVLSLEDIGALQNCVLAMNKIVARIKSLAKQSKPISFEGLDHFGTKVVFAKVGYTQQLRDIVQLVRKTLTDMGVNVENKLFNPHLTLFKVKRSANWVWVNLNLRQYDDVMFGEQYIDNIKVCRMGTLPELSHGQTGFYTSVLKFYPLESK